MDQYVLERYQRIYDRCMLQASVHERLDMNEEAARFREEAQIAQSRMNKIRRQEAEHAAR